METLAIENLSFRYPQSESNVLKNINLRIKSGEFVTLCGVSGSGKSTLLRHLKPALTPHGTGQGRVLFNGQDINSLDHREQSEKIGFVQQSPDNQIVTDKVWHELSFGLENLGLPQDVIRRRTAETASFFGIQQMFGSSVSQLSGGQKQLLNLASVTAMQPELLILDEPTSQLDPIAAADFLACVAKINRELGVTVIITEHRLEEIIPVSDRVIVIEDGAVISDDTPQNTGANLKKAKSKCFYSLPSPMRIWDAVEKDGAPCPVTIAQGREWLERFSEKNGLHGLPPEKIPPAGETAVELKNVWFRYEKNSPDVIKHLSLTVKKGEFLAVLGGNGTGKSTLISLLNGTNKPYSGKYISNNELCLTMPQNPQVLFDGSTVMQTLENALINADVPQEEREPRLQSVISLCQLDDFTERHPFDLSGGEAQKAALAKLLLLSPDILLLDEPTKGLDAHFKAEFAGIINDLVSNGAAVVMISHDAEFCAKYCHRCLMMFNGELIAGGTPREFFGSNSFYVTSATRMAKKIIPGAITAEDVIFCCTGELPPEITVNKPKPPKAVRKKPLEKPKKKLPLWKRLCGIFGAVMLLFGILENLNALPFLKADTLPMWANYSFIAISVVLLMLAFGTKTRRIQKNAYQKRKPAKSIIAAAVVTVLLIPFTIYAGVVFLQDQKYIFISLLIILEAMIPFYLVFEGRKPQARELVLIAVMCAITVAGRSAFAALPQIKPVLALVIISGAAFGSETGFIIGATSMLVSNMFFGQGAWTPWQMFAAGIIGFISGLLLGRGVFLQNKAVLCVYGFVMTVAVYGGIMNFSSLILSRTPVSYESVLAFMAQGLPFDIIHGASTAAFLFFLADPMLEKLDRIKIKYDLYNSIIE